MTTITIIGSLNYDLVTYTAKVPEAGETFQAKAFENHLGGKGLNEAIAVARLSGGKVATRMVGNIGDDSFGKELKGALVDANVDTQYVKTIEGISSGVAVILVEESGENRILITAGANGQLKPTDEEYEKYFPEDSGYVVLQNEYPHTVESISWLKAHRPAINIAYNPSPYNPAYITEEFLRKIDLLIVNEGEAMDVAKSVLKDEEIRTFETSIQHDIVEGFSTLAAKLGGLINQHNINVVIITLGSKGAVFSSKSGNTVFEKAVKVENVVDTTGAGDTFFGGVVAQIAGGHSVAEAVKFGTRASSLVIQKKGAVESIPTIDELK